MTDSDESPISTILIDPDDIAGTGLATLLNADSRFAVLRAVRSLHEAQLARHRPDLICCDPRSTGRLRTEIIDELRSAAPNARVCVMSATLDPCFVLEAGMTTTHLFLHKGGDAGPYILNLLEIVARTGGSFIDGPIVDRFRERERGQLVLQQPAPEAKKLTARELEVLHLFAYGSQVEEIAAKLRIDHRTVSTHLTSAEKKLGARSRAEFVRLATEQGLLSTEPDTGAG